MKKPHSSRQFLAGLVPSAMPALAFAWVQSPALIVSSLLLAVSFPAAAQSISSLQPLDQARTQWQINVTVPADAAFSVQTSVDLVQWTQVLGGQVGTGSSQLLTLSSISGDTRYFRLATQQSTSDFILSWDISESNPVVGVVMVDGANRFAATEIKETTPQGTIRRNAGLYFVDRASGTRVSKAGK